MVNHLRIGLVGTCRDLCAHHVSEFRKIEGVEITSINSPCADKCQELAQEFEIPATASSYQDLISDSEIDAVVIGSHRNGVADLTQAALASGKHVLLPAGIAKSLDETLKIQKLAADSSDLVVMRNAGSYCLRAADYVREQLNQLIIGNIREVVVVGANDSGWDYTQFFDPSLDSKLHGYHAHQLTSLQNLVEMWCPETVELFAQGTIFEPERPLENTHEKANVTVPDSMQIVSQLAGGARALYHLSRVALFGPGQQIHIYGSEGTLKFILDDGNQQNAIYVGRIGSDNLQKIEVPEKYESQWGLHEQFVAAINHNQPRNLHTLETGLRTARFLNAVEKSLESKSVVQV